MSRSGNLRVATFNIQHGLTVSGKVHVGAVARSCAGLDVDLLALQEVDVGVRRSGRVNTVDLVAKAAGMAAVFGPAQRLGVTGRGQYGNALFVRGELTDVHTSPLPRHPGREPRAATVATAHTKGRRFTVLTTHLSVQPDEAVDQLTRATQLLAERPGPHLLLGDLNLAPETVMSLLRGTGLEVVEGGPTFPASAPALQIDHVAVAGFTVVDIRVAPRAPVSDHRALVVSLA